MIGVSKYAFRWKKERWSSRPASIRNKTTWLPSASLATRAPTATKTRRHHTPKRFIHNEQARPGTPILYPESLQRVSPELNEGKLNRDIKTQLGMCALFV